MNVRLTTLFAVAACLALAASALAAGPQLISYQGTLTDDLGQPLDGTHDLTFSIYPTAGGGTPLWTQTSANVVIADGLFSVLLGTTVFPSGLFTSADRWLGITIDHSHELTPLMRFTSVPWALRATVADTALVGITSSDGSWTISGSNMYSAVSGNVGIGATAPGRKLQVGNSSTLNSEGMIRLGSRSGTNGSNRTWDIGVPETDAVSSGIGYSFIIDDVGNSSEAELLVKFDTGNVGIGTITPGAKLTVAGDIEATDGITGQGSITTSNSSGDMRVNTTADPGEPGVVLTYGISDNMACRMTWLEGNPINGYVSVQRGAAVPAAGMYVNSLGQGIVYATVKNFREPSRKDGTKDLWYACIEGPEAAIYTRGTASLVAGTATVALPDHFQEIAASEGMTVQITPRSAESKGLAVVSRDIDRFVVRELGAGTGAYEFDWEVKAVRRAHRDYRVERPWDESLPGGTDKAAAWQERLSSIAEQDSRIELMEGRGR